MTKILFLTICSAVVLYSCKENTQPTPQTNNIPLPVAYIGRFITHHHNNSIHEFDTMENCVLTPIIYGEDSAIKVTIFIPQLDSYLTVITDVLLVASGENRLFMANDTCHQTILNLSTDSSSVSYHRGSFCQPGIDHSFDGTR